MFLKISPSKYTFPKLLPQKMHFQNWSVNMKSPSSKIKKFKKEISYISENGTPEKTSISGGNFLSSENKITCTEKFSYISGNWTFQPQA